MEPRSTGLMVAAGYCIFAGLSEVWVGITGNWMGLLAKPMKPSFVTALVGAFYVAAGLSLLSRGRAGAPLAVVLILLEMLGRVHLVRTGAFPAKGPDAVKNVVGGLTAAAVAVYVAKQRQPSE